MNIQSTKSPDQFGVPSLPNEIWKDVEGHEGSYLISNHGRVFSIGKKIVRRNKGDILPIKPKLLSLNGGKNGGFLGVGLKENGNSRRFSIHILVAKHFVENPLSLINVRHIDGNRRNNHFSNLEWYNNVSVNSKINELWKDYPGFEGLYQVSNLGRVLRFYKGEKRIRKAYFQRKEGYFSIDLHKDNMRHKALIHRMVATCFVHNSNPEVNIQVNHKNGVKTDNHYLNLEWVTKSENAKHAVKMGLTKKLRVKHGETNNHAKLKREDILEIRKLFNEGWKMEAIGRKFKVTGANISMICKRKTWKHIV